MRDRILNRADFNGNIPVLNGVRESPTCSVAAQEIWTRILDSSVNPDSTLSIPLYLIHC